tara:strand:+ start:198 stop:467 length:270 start_codon:yes stop_codon:yes gene_type:complete
MGKGQSKVRIILTEEEAIMRLPKEQFLRVEAAFGEVIAFFFFLVIALRQQRGKSMLTCAQFSDPASGRMKKSQFQNCTILHEAGILHKV